MLEMPRPRCRHFNRACLLVLLFPLLAFAVMPPWVYQRAREEATYHIQVRILRMAGPDKTPGECSVVAEVVRIFRDKSAALTTGTTLDFTVSCSKAGDRVPIGGTLWTDHDRLMQAKFLEVFLNSDGGRYQVALWQSRIIEVPTEQPTFPPTTAGTP